MTDTSLHPPVAPGTPSPDPAAPHLGWAVAGLSAGAGVIHLAMVPIHGGGSLLDPLGFAAFGWFQLLVAAVILADRGGKRLYQAAALVNGVAVGLWAWSRTSGLPFGNHPGITEDVGAIDAAAVFMEAGAVLLAARILLAPGRTAIGRLAPAMVAVAALGLTTTVITSPDASSHGQDEAPVVSEHDALVRKIDATRCDKGFNIPAYYQEAAYLGVDTYLGGAMPADHATAAPSADGHHGAAAGAAGTTTTTEPDPTGGRGSVVLDTLVTDTSLSTGGEGAAAKLVVDLGKADQKDYDAWLWWLRNSGAAGGSHGGHDAAAPGDSGGHGGHSGPQPWTALTKRSDCDRLAAELKLARETALKYPTAADAVAAGWYRVTGYVPGIAAHYMNFKLVDDEFRVDQPEMILYDGNGPDAHVVGLSYYLIHKGDAAPTQGFTGPNDASHRHIGLCVGKSGVIGDSTTTEEECAARGGAKSGGNDAWMSHAWVVPGCESPWGVFSAASPVLESALGKASGKNAGGCSASGVRDRYRLDEVASPVSAAKARPGDDRETAATTGG